MSEDSQENKKSEETVPEQFRTFIESIEKMSVIELNEFVKVLEKRFGVSAAALAPSSAVGGTAAGPVEEKSTVTVELKDGGAQKIAVIKLIKEALGFGLKEAKDLVDGVPIVLKENMKKVEAEELKKKLEEVGAKVELR